MHIKKIFQIGLLVYFGFGALIFISHRGMIYHPHLIKSDFYYYPVFLLEKFSKENYNNMALLRGYEGDLRIIHGAKDKIIPFKHGKALFENTNTSNKEFIIIDGAGHNDIYNFEKTWKSISDFL
ncbi:alpha/beta hydrolase [Patescibacteria group bacterium AH-259-L07]|nr:alpha/beta hydrolase [Patescibacteria group bacterium AH-259-L07]